MKHDGWLLLGWLFTAAMLIAAVIGKPFALVFALGLAGVVCLLCDLAAS